MLLCILITCCVVVFGWFCFAYILSSKHYVYIHMFVHVGWVRDRHFSTRHTQQKNNNFDVAHAKLTSLLMSPGVQAGSKVLYFSDCFLVKWCRSYMGSGRKSKIMLFQLPRGRHCLRFVSPKEEFEWWWKLCWMCLNLISCIHEIPN